MVFRKRCPRCHGDMFLDKDHYGTYIQCLQCSYIKDLHPPTYTRDPKVPSPVPEKLAA